MMQEITYGVIFFIAKEHWTKSGNGMRKSVSFRENTNMFSNLHC